MNESNLKKALFLMLFIVIVTIAAWEIYLISQSIMPAYDDNAALWANQRKRVYEPADETVVFIGSSRIKYDLDIPTWKKNTGKKAVQLAMTGSDPLPVLENLANDVNFKGNLVIDVTEFIFFSNAPHFSEKPNTNISYFKEETPAQKASFHVNQLLESQLVFLDKEQLSINAKLKQLQIPNRPGVFVLPPFPLGFERTQSDEQVIMSPEFVATPSQQHQMSDIWHMIMGGPPPPPMPEATLQNFFTVIKDNIDKIRVRGGHVVFVRTPSSGGVYQGEKMGFPRAKFWDRLLKETGCSGYYFADYPLLAKMVCPEESHLKPTDAVIYTQLLASLLQNEPILQTAKNN